MKKPLLALLLSLFCLFCASIVASHIYAGPRQDKDKIRIDAGDGDIWPNGSIQGASLGTEDWFSLQHDFSRTGSTPDLFYPPLGIDRIFSTGKQPKGIWISPVVSGTTLYFCTGKTLYALDTTTWTTLWTFTDGRRDLWTPTVFGSYVYVPARLPYDGIIYKLDATTGAVVCSHRVSAEVEPVAVGNGMVYFGYGTYWLGPYGIRAIDVNTCATVWEYRSSVHNFGPPALSEDMTRLVAARRNAVYCFDALTGNVLWTYNAGSAWQVRVPAVVGSTVYAYNAGAGSTWAFALDLNDGHQIWKTDLPRLSDYVQPPAVADGKMYVVLGERLYALDCLTGQILWNFGNNPGTLNNAPVVTMGGVVYLTAGDSLCALSTESGEVLWKYSLGGLATNCIPAISNEVLYSLNDRGDLTSFLSLAQPQVLTATVDLDPNVLNKKSRGRWITCYIELPDEYDPADIDVSSLTLNELFRAEPAPTCVSDYDGDGTRDLMVKFNRSDVITLLGDLQQAQITLEGALVDGTSFAGLDTVRATGQCQAADLAGTSLTVRSNLVRFSVSISYELNEPGIATLRIFDVRGRLVRTLVNRPESAGRHDIVWDGIADSHRRVSAGVYFIKLEHEGRVSSAKIMLLR